MPRSRQDSLDHADDLAAQAESAEPAGDGHSAMVAELRSAVIASAVADQAIVDAGAAARADGLPWTAIGLILGTSGEAARKRYGQTPSADVT